MVAEVVTDVAPAQGADLKAAAAGAGKLARPEKPDRSKYEKQVETLKDQVSKCLDTMGELSKKIDKLKEARKGKEGPMAEPRAKLIEYRTQLKAIYDEKSAIQAQLKAMDAQKEQNRAQLKAIRDKCQYVKIEDIDSAVQRLEEQMAHTTMTLNEEKKIVQQVSDLRKSRTLLKELHESMNITGDGASMDRDVLMDKIREMNGKIKTLRQEEDEQRKIMDELRSKDDSKDEIPALIKKKNDQYEVMKKCKETLNKLRDDRKKIEDAYWKKEKEWRAQAKIEKQKRFEENKVRWEEEKKRKEIEKKQRDLDNAGEPFDREVTTCDQLVSYLNKFTSDNAKADADAPSAANSGLDAGATIVGKKAQLEQDCDGWWSGLGGKKSKGKKRNAKSEKIVHSMDIINSFSILGLAAPLNKEAMPPLYEKIAAKKAEYLEKRIGANKKREEERAAIKAKIEAGDFGSDAKVDGEAKENGNGDAKADGKVSSGGDDKKDEAN